MSKEPTFKELEAVLSGILTSTCESFIGARRGKVDYVKVATIVAENAGKIVGGLCYSNIPLLAEERDASVATAVTTFEKAARSAEQEVAQTADNLHAILSKMADSLTDVGQTTSEEVESAVEDLLKRAR